MLHGAQIFMYIHFDSLISSDHQNKTIMAEREKSVVVEKPIPVTFDFGNLAVFDTNPLDAQLLKDPQTKEQCLTETTRDNVQLLISQILQLPLQKTSASNTVSSNQDSTMVLFHLPDPVTPLPREKPLPRARELTKWEKFALKKGIKKRAKDGKLVFDEATGKWVPKWGYGGINKKLDDQWLVEVDGAKSKKGEEPEDPRKLNRLERKKLVKKNQLRQEKNAK